MSEQKFTILEIKNYITSQDSLGDVLYNLSVENILKAQPEIVLTSNNNFQYFLLYNNDCELRIPHVTNLESLNVDDKILNQLLELAFDDYMTKDNCCIYAQFIDGKYQITRKYNDQNYKYNYNFYSF